MGRDYKRTAFGTVTELYRFAEQAVGETEALIVSLSEYLLLNYCCVYVGEGRRGTSKNVKGR